MQVKHNAHKGTIMDYRSVPTLFILTLFAPQAIYSFSFFDELEQELNRLHQQMEQQFLTSKKEASSSITETKNGLVISISGIDAEDVTGTFNEDCNCLTVVADGVTALVKAQGSLVSVITKEEETSNNAGGAKFHSSRSSQAAHNCSHPVQLENPAIEYNKADKKLSLTFSFEKKKKG